MTPRPPRKRRLCSRFRLHMQRADRLQSRQQVRVATAITGVLCMALLIANGVLPEPPATRTHPPMDLVVPPVSDREPAPGLRVRCQLPEYQGTQLYHL
ncbi:MAG: hypothetical protein AAGD07_18440 [Planctomycetota bacterium]